MNTQRSMTVSELALAVACPKCGARRDQTCAEAMKRAAIARGADEKEIDELRRIEVLTGTALAHPERFKATEELIESAIAYGLVAHVPPASG